MASPFKVFRKNQKAALAVLTVVAMGGFVILPTVLQMMGSGNQAAARLEVVSTTRYGSLDASDLAGLRRDRQAVRGFLDGVENLVRVKQRNWRTPVVAQEYQALLGADDRALVETWLLVQHAEELGVVVDDPAVNSFIEEVTEGAVSQTDLIGSGGADRGLLGQLELPESQLFRLLKYEITALRLRRLVLTGLMPMTPGERWDYYQRLHRNMSIELAEVPTERFVASVNDPDEATLKKFFDKYKEKENIPESPEPGFRVPKQIAVEYFKVDYDHLFEPGELEKYYEEHKEEFKRESLPAVKPSDPAPELEGSLPGLNDPQLDLPPVGGAAPDMTETPKSETEPAKAVEEEPAKAEATETKGDASKPEQAKPEEPKAETSEKADDAPKPTDESQATRRSLFQLTAYLAEEKAESQPAEEKPAEEAKADEKPAEEMKADENPVEPKADDPQGDGSPEKSESAENMPAEEQPVEEKKAEEKPVEPTKDEPKSDGLPEKSEAVEQMPAEEKPAEPADDPKTDTNALTDDMPKFEPPSEYYTFEEVKSQIQSRLAPDKIEKLFRPLENQMTLYHDAQIRYIRTQDEQGNSTVPEPVKLDFAKLAAEAGVEAKKTNLFSQREAVRLQLDIARSSITLGDRPAEFLSYAFDSLPEFRPTRSQDREGNYYLFWKIQQEADRVPELDDPGIRPMVVSAWKMIQAREAAQADADRLASEARAKQKASEEPVSLATALAGEQGITVQTTEPFTWFDSISIQLTMMGYGQPRLSTIQLVMPEPKEGEEPAEAETVPLIGADFMRTVAALDKGSIGVAWNEAKTVAYVVRMVETTPEAKELRSLFLASADPRQLGIVASIERGEAFREWLESLEASVGLEWQQ